MSMQTNEQQIAKLRAMLTWFTAKQMDEMQIRLNETYLRGMKG